MKHKLHSMNNLTILRFVLLTFALALSAHGQISPETSRSVAIAGSAYAIGEITSRIITPANLKVEAFDGIPVPVTEYAKHRAIIFAERDEKSLNDPTATWDTPEAIRQVKDYLKSGGIVIFCHYGIGNVFPKRELGAGAELAGFASYPDAKEPTTVSLTSAGEAWLRKAGEKPPEGLEWLVGSCPVAKGLTSAEELAVVTTATSGEDLAFATRNDVGNGQVYFFATSLNRLVRERRGSESVDGFAALLRASLSPPSR